MPAIDSIVWRQTESIFASYPFQGQRFWNQCVQIFTSIGPQGLLAYIQQSGFASTNKHAC